MWGVNARWCHHVMLALYPCAWRERYGDEMLELLGARSLTLRAIIDLLGTAVMERMWPTVGRRDSVGVLVFRGTVLAMGSAVVARLMWGALIEVIRRELPDPFFENVIIWALVEPASARDAVLALLMIPLASATGVTLVLRRTVRFSRSLALGLAMSLTPVLSMSFAWLWYAGLPVIYTNGGPRLWPGGLALVLGFSAIGFLTAWTPRDHDPVSQHDSLCGGRDGTR
jgi:hypothetical protein